MPTARTGDSGTWVYLVQDALVRYGYFLTVDGSFGPQTETVVRSYQASQPNLVVDGIVGRATWQRLMGNIQ